MLTESLRVFSSQLIEELRVENPLPTQRSWQEIIICGMGGSHLAGDILRARIDAEKGEAHNTRITIWKDYKLPPKHRYDPNETLVIVSSYSGNTEEAVSAYAEAQNRELPLAVITSGGLLLEQAERDAVTHVKLPDSSLQPRLSVGLQLVALTSLLGLEEYGRELADTAPFLEGVEFSKDALDIAQEMAGSTPIIYAPTEYYHMAYIWKIMLNETGKFPAFSNVFPEANHNELESFLSKEGVRINPSFWLLRSGNERSSITKRMESFAGLYEQADLPVYNIDAEGATFFRENLYLFLLAGWTALHLAELRDIDPEAVVHIEEFKKLLT